MRKNIYTKTGKGSLALPNCDSLLTQNECRILSLINGKFTYDDLQARLSSLLPQELRKSIDFLTKEGYIRHLRSEEDAHAPISKFGVTELDTEHGVKEWAAATRAAKALNQQGYYLAKDDKSPCEGPQQILIIDDEQAIGEVVAAVLGNAGFVVEWLGDPREALEKVQSMPCLVLVLLDVVMPHVDGFEVLRSIRKQPSMHRMPVVMLTAHANPEYVAEGLRDGADGYILKPFKPEKLIRYLQDTLQSK
jgi:CheY-like chemotaxis protein/DNA-binding MarR family transcriptional regulator